MAEIAVEGLTKRFGETVALDEVSFEIPDGEFVIVLGVSGSGKSTLLRCLNGLTRPTAGTVTIRGDPITGQQKDVAMVFQQHNIIGQMSAYSNALTGALSRTGYFRSILQLQDGEEKRRALEALETTDLLDQAQQRARRMSGGQQQRVGIARALVQDPTILLADEPVSSLDPASSQEVMRYLRKASEERDLTTLISLHQVNLARKFGQRFIGLRDGELVFDGYREALTMEVIDEIYGGLDTEGMIQADDGGNTEGSAAESAGAETAGVETADSETGTGAPR